MTTVIDKLLESTSLIKTAQKYTFDSRVKRVLLGISRLDPTSDEPSQLDAWRTLRTRLACTLYALVIGPDEQAACFDEHGTGDQCLVTCREDAQLNTCSERSYVRGSCTTGIDWCTNVRWFSENCR